MNLTLFQPRSRTWLILLLLALAGGGGFGLGYLRTDSEWKKTMALHSLVSIDNALRIQAYCQQGNTAALKDLLDVRIDGELTTLVEYQSYVLDDPNYQGAKASIFGALKTYWKKSPPFASAEWDRMRQDPAWIDLRRRNEAFLSGVP